MDIFDYLKLMVEKNASDLFYRAGATVRMRVNVLVLQVADKNVTLDDIDPALQKLLSDDLRELFRRSKDIDFAYFDPELKRWQKTRGF